MIREKVWLHELKDMPAAGPGDNYAIVEFGSIYIPGDERSRTNPGHGYPGGSEPKTDVILFSSREAWEAEIKSRVESKSSSQNGWAPIVFRRATITTNVTVD